MLTENDLKRQAFSCTRGAGETAPGVQPQGLSRPRDQAALHWTDRHGTSFIDIMPPQALVSLVVGGRRNLWLARK